MRSLGLGLGLGGAMESGDQAWIPADLPGTVAVWDARYSKHTIGTGVASWTDLVGGVVVSQGTGSAQPTLNSPDASYNNDVTLGFSSAASQILLQSSFTLAQTITAIFVGNVGTPGVSGQEFFDTDGSGRCLVEGVASTGFLTAYAGSGLDASTTPLTAPCVVAYQFSGATSKAWVNNSGSTVNVGTNPGTQGFGGIGIGGTAGGYLNGKLAYLQFVGGTLTAAQLKQAFAHLGSRFGISVS